LNQQFRHRQFPAGNPLANVLVVIAGIVVISLSLALGFFVFLGIAGFVLIMAAVAGIRNWWLRRNIDGRTRQAQSRQGGRAGARRIIEGEYREVRRKDED